MTARVLLVDDSAAVRHTLASVLGAAGDIEVAGTAGDGLVALRRIADCAPTVVTLDIDMPGIDGLETLRRIREQHPALPVIMYSALGEAGAAATLEAMALGASDYAAKPSGATDRAAVADQIRDNLVPLVRYWGTRAAPRSPAPQRLPRPRAAEPAGVAESARSAVDLVVVGVSTGGPDALAELVPLLPADLRVPVLVVQHMPPSFTAILAQRLDALSALTVTEAGDGEIARGGGLYIAPGGRHLEARAVGGQVRLALTDGPPEQSCRPAVDVLFRSAARATRGRLLGVVLTGMGQDGLAGSREIVGAGGSVVVQDEATSVVWGMPGAVSRAGLARETHDLVGLADTITEAVR